GRGKGITTMGGGILVTPRQDLARRIDRIVRTVPRPAISRACVALGGSLMYAAMLQPSRYWLLDHVPFLELGSSHFEPDFPIERLSAYQTRLARRLFSFLDRNNAIRREH